MRAVHCGTVGGDAYALHACASEVMEENLLNLESICPTNNDILNHQTEPVQVVLVEDDIPGAKLCKPVEQCSVAILKRWLLCRNARITGTKPELIQRYLSFTVRGSFLSSLSDGLIPSYVTLNILLITLIYFCS